MKHVNSEHHTVNILSNEDVMTEAKSLQHFSIRMWMCVHTALVPTILCRAFEMSDFGTTFSHITKSLSAMSTSENNYFCVFA